MTSPANSTSQPREVPPLMTATWEAATSDSDPLAAVALREH